MMGKIPYTSFLGTGFMGLILLDLGGVSFLNILVNSFLILLVEILVLLKSYFQRFQPSLGKTSVVGKLRFLSKWKVKLVVTIDNL